MRRLPEVWQEFDRPFLTMGGWRPLLRQLDDLFNEAERTKTDKSTLLTPACDVEEDEGHYILCFDIPGVNKENIDIEVHGNELTVSAERSEEHDEKKGKSRFVERRYGKFYRSVALPTDVASDKVEAVYKNGVLKVAVPKVEQAKTQKVKITEGETGFFKNLLGSRKDKTENRANTSEFPRAAGH